MNDRDNRKIEVISNIDDEIISRVGKKRFELMHKLFEKKPNNKRIIAWISIAASLFLIFGGVLALILGNVKQVPIYTGMTVSSTLDGTASVAELPSFENDLERLAHEAVMLDYSEKDGKDRNNKHDKNDAQAEETTDSLDVQGANALYYAKPNSDIYITVHIDNPDDFEILSFTLNGNKYSSYMFEQGSDMENLILKVNIGDVEGIISYTIDAIKYVDGTDIKDVRMEGDRVVRIAVETDKLPTATVSAEAVSFSDISFNVDIIDELSLIEMIGGTVYAKLYCEDTLVDSKELSIDGEEVKFDGLEVNTVYKYVISASYDALTGEGVKEYELSSKAFKTKAPVLFSEPTVSKTGAQISFVKETGCEDIKIDSIELWHNGNKIKDIPTDAAEISGLLSNNEYVLKAYYTFENDTKEITAEFKTQAKIVPTVAIVSPTKTQTSVGFGITVTDTDAVGSITKIELLHGNDTPVELDIKTSHTIENLLSNNLYTVKVTYEYDLNDGVGKQEIVKTLDIKTEAKAVPTVAISTPTKTQTSIGFEVNVTDTDAVGSITKIELLHGNDTPTVAANASVRAFENLLSNNDYTVRVTYEYDLNDGVGKQEIVKTLDIKTEAKAVPTFELTDLNVEEYKISFGVKETDIDEICDPINVELYKGESLITQSVSFDGVAFENLLPNTNYKIVVNYKYDLNDGKGIIETTFETNVKTSPYVSFNGINYKLNDDGTAEVIGSDENISELVFECTEGYVITSIGASAFSQRNNLTSVVIPDSVTSIGYEAFYNCENLSSITIPVSVTSVGDYAFDACKITTATIHKNIIKYIHKEYLETLTVVGGGSIADSAFNGYTSLKSVTLGDGITSIGNSAFYGCAGLTSISIPDSVTSIGESAFSGCTSLNYNVYDGAKYLGNENNKYVFLEVAGTSTRTIHEATKIIDNNAFQHCDDLTSITIPDSVISIGYEAFFCCTNLKSVTIGNGVKNMGNALFAGCTSLTSVTVGDNLTNISMATFSECESITYNIYKSAKYLGNENNKYLYLLEAGAATREIHESTKLIGDYAFRDCTGLRSITIPDSVTSIGNYAFDGCTSLTSVTIGSGVTSIGNYAFNGCSGLTDITIPDSVTSMGDYAFRACTRLTSVTFENTTGWLYNGASIDVTNPTTNATNLKNGYSYTRS